MSLTFEGFPNETISFLTELGTQDKAWMQANKKDYTRLVADPAKAFVVAMGERLQTEIGPTIAAVPKTNGSIAPINNDLRFSPDKSPYKDHVMFRFWDGPEKKTAPTLFVRIAPDTVGFATGAALPDLERWRARVDDNAAGTALAGELGKLGKGRDLDIAGQEYKRVPKPFAEDHPRADLLRHKSLQARWTEPTSSAPLTTPQIVDWCMERLDACAPVHHWLVENL